MLGDNVPQEYVSNLRLLEIIENDIRDQIRAYQEFNALWTRRGKHVASAIETAVADEQQDFRDIERCTDIVDTATRFMGCVDRREVTREKLNRLIE